MTTSVIRLHVLGIAVLVGGCGGSQSVLHPKGPQALQLAQLSWLLFASAAVILVIVVLATTAAVLGPAWLRSLLASGRTVVWAGIVFPTLALTALLVSGVWLTRASTALPGDPDALRIEVVGEQWWWRVIYQQPDGREILTANEIRMPTGRTVVFSLRSADVIHSFWIPNLGGKLDMIPGRVTQMRLRADHAGVLRGQCAEYCGGPHALMAFEVVVMPPVEFDAWLEAQARPALAPGSAAADRGRALFLAAGCGACHTVRGTPAVGTIGPDLTHLGSRRSVGVDTAAMSEANIARFIRDGQHIKPGNLMPPFRIFATADLEAIAVYLAALR